LPAKPALILLGAAALGLLGLSPLRSAPAKAPLPTVLLYPATSGDVAALVDLRTRLRLDSRVQVLTYDPESAAIQRAAAEKNHPDWLVHAPTNDSGRMTLARALGASFYAVISPGRLVDTTHVELVETAPAARTFDWTGTNRQFGAHALESQVADSQSHPANYDKVADNSPAPFALPSPLASAPLDDIETRTIPSALPAAAAPVPAAAAPVPAAAAPVPAAAAPVPASAAPVPASAAPVPASAAPELTVPQILLPLIKSVPVPLSLPTQVAQAAPIAPAPRPIRIILPKTPQTASAPPPTSVTPPKAPVKVAAAPQSQTAPPKTAPPVKIASPVKVAQVPPIAVTPSPKSALPPTVILLPTVVPPPVKIAALPPRVIPTPAPALPETPTPQIAPPTPPSVVKKHVENAEDMTAIQPLLARGDAALDGGDTVSAIALYRQAVNGAPLSVVPRLKLAQAYVKDGLSGRALDEARRALQIAPDSEPVQQFLADLDQQTGTSVGALIKVRAALERSPSNPAAHTALADVLWNSGDLSGAEAEYKAASALSPAGSHAALAQLAQLYAAEARYDDCLATLKNSGPGGYALAIGIVKNRADTLSSTLAASRAAFAASKSTREQFYDDAKKLSAQAQALADFVAAVIPPAAYKLPHLHRMLSTSLLAQESAALVGFIETGDARRSDSMAQLEHAAATEMLTAQAVEERLGLWKQHLSKD